MKIIFTDYSSYIWACYAISFGMILLFYIHAKLRLFESNKKLTNIDLS